MYGRVGAEAGTLDVGLRKDGASITVDHVRSELDGAAHGMHAFVTPPVRGALIAVAFDGLRTTAPHCLVRCADVSLASFRGRPYTLYHCALIVVRHEAAAIGVLHVHIVIMAADAVEARGRSQIGEECVERGDRLIGCAGELCENITV